MQYVHDNDITQNKDDEDDDRIEFADARLEEVMDKIKREFRKQGRPLTKREVKRIARANQVDYFALDENVLRNVMDELDFNRILDESQLRETTRMTGHAYVPDA